MKLLNCLACQDIVLLQNETRTCKCGKSSGRYASPVLAEYQGPARIIAMRSIDYVRGEVGTRYSWWFVGHSSHLRKLDANDDTPAKPDSSSGRKA